MEIRCRLNVIIDLHDVSMSHRHPIKLKGRCVVAGSKHLQNVNESLIFASFIFRL